MHKNVVVVVVLFSLAIKYIDTFLPAEDSRIFKVINR